MDEAKEKANLKEEVMNRFKALQDAYKRVKSGGSLDEEKP